MVNVVIPSQRSSGTIDMGTGDMNLTMGDQQSHTLEHLADNVGLTDKMHQMNHESRQYDEQLRSDHLDDGNDDQGQYDDNQEYTQEYSNEQSEERPKRRKKSKDKRFDDLTRNYHLEREQREEYENEVKRLRDENAQIKLLRDEHAAMVLKLEQKEINENLKKVSDIMVQAKDEGDHTTYVKANLLSNKLTMKEAENERAYAQIQERYSQYDHETVEDNSQELAIQEIAKRADPRDLRSEYFDPFLKEHPYADARNGREFDPDLADELFSHKKKFDKSLKLSRQADYIGTPDYYKELNDVLADEMQANVYKPKRKQSGRAQQYQEEPSFEDDGYYDPQEDQMSKYVVNVDPNNHEYYMRDDGAPNYMTSDPSNSRLQSSRPVYEPLAPGASQYNNQRQYHTPREYQGAPRQQMRRTNPNVNPAYRGGGQVQNQMGPLPRLSQAEEVIALKSPMRDMRGRLLTEREKIEQYQIAKREQQWNQGR